MKQCSLTSSLDSSLSANKSIDKPRRLGVWVFFVAILCQALPIGRELVSSERVSAEVRHIALLYRAETVGIEQTWLGAVLWGGIYLASIWIVSRINQHRCFYIMGKMWPIFVLLIIMLFRIDFSWHVNAVMMNALHAIGVTIFAYAVSIVYENRFVLFINHLMMALGLNVFIHIVAVLVAPGFSVAYDGRWYGLTTNSNTLGMIAALAIWSAGIAWMIRASERVWQFSVGVVGSLALYGSGSVTATISVSAGLLLALAVANVGRYARHTLALILLAMPSSLLLGYVFHGQIASFLATAFGKSADFSGRFKLWEMSLDLLCKCPIFGWGFDNNLSIMRVYSLSTVHFHNGYIDLAIRGGFVALCMFFLFGLVDYTTSKCTGWNCSNSFFFVRLSYFGL